MLQPCHFVLDSRKPCHAPALHNGSTCRHHTPEALARRQARLDDLHSDKIPSNNPPESNGTIDAAHLRAYWRMQHAAIAASTDDEQCQQIFDMILLALSEHAISPRSAGRLLQAIMDRRRFLAEQAKEATFRAVEAMASLHRRQVAAGETPDPRALLETLRNAAPYLPPLPNPGTKISPPARPLPAGAPEGPQHSSAEAARTASALEALGSTAFSAPRSGPPARQVL